MRHRPRTACPSASTTSPSRRVGFTLVETLMVSAIFAIVGVLSLQWFTNISQYWEVVTAQGDLRAHAEQALETMKRELHLATRNGGAIPPNLAIPAAPNNTQITFYLPMDADGNGTIVDATGNIEWNPPCNPPPPPCAVPTPITYAYTAASGQITRTEGAAQRVIAHDVSTALFDDQTTDGALYANEVRIRLTTQRTTPHNRTVSAAATTRIELKN